MPTLQTTLNTLTHKASEKTRITYLRHGSPADKTLGVSIADLKLIASTIKRQQALALDLYATGIFEAMYLAGLVADGSQMTPKLLHTWAQKAPATMISEHTVPWVTVENPAARDLANEWIHSKEESVASAGWCTWSGIVALTPDAALDLKHLEALLAEIIRDVPAAQNRVRYTMNGFVIALGTYVAPLLPKAKIAAYKIGPLSIDVGDTSCQVPLATDYLAKNESSHRIGKKRKTIRC